MICCISMRPRGHDMLCFDAEYEDDDDGDVEGRDVRKRKEKKRNREEEERQNGRGRWGIIYSKNTTRISMMMGRRSGYGGGDGLFKTWRILWIEVRIGRTWRVWWSQVVQCDCGFHSDLNLSDFFSKKRRASRGNRRAGW